LGLLEFGLNVRDWVVIGLSIEPSLTHRSDKICVRDWEAGRRADDRVDTAMRAEGRSALVFHPFLDIIDREYLLAEEAATSIANVQLRFVIGGVTVRSVKRLERKTHQHTFV
jgi:hypothetical protein